MQHVLINLGSFRPNSIGCQVSSWSTKKKFARLLREYIHLAKHQAGLPSPSEKTLDPVISKEPSGEQKPFQPQVVRLSASNHWLLKLTLTHKFKSISIYICICTSVMCGMEKTNLQCKRYMLYYFLLSWYERNASKKCFLKSLVFLCHCNWTECFFVETGLTNLRPCA